MKKNLGFTLIELLVVMAILALLATVGLGSFNSVRIKSKDAQRKSDLSQIQKGLEMYYNDKGGYPAEGADGKIMACGADRSSPGDCLWGSPWELEGTLYMKTLPEDVRRNYCYDSAGGSNYRLYAQLENTRDPNCLGGDCATPRSCGSSGNIYNYGVSSANVSP